jgi:GNAT superfamily N-acetyltransferase
MNARGEPALMVRTAVAADLPALRRVFRSASLSNAGDAAMLLARPELLIFAGEGIAGGRTRVATTAPDGDGPVLGFVTVAMDHNDGPELEDLFVDPEWRRRGIGRRLVQDVVRTARQTGHRRLWVTGNPHALAFYLAIGFASTGQIATELGIGLRMCLDTNRTRPDPS